MNLNKPCCENFLLTKKYMIDVEKIPFVSNFSLDLSFEKKHIIIEKLLEAHELAFANIHAGNITKRGFAVNACSNYGLWGIGTNFNNTRNEISSICAERSAILSLYNKSLLNFMKKNDGSRFEFKVKYLCMAQAIDLNEPHISAVPCEDCLSWFNTNRYFSDDTIIFSFEKNNESGLIVKAVNLIELLPYRNLKTSNIFDKNKPVKFSNGCIEALQKYNLTRDKIVDILYKTYTNYKDIKLKNVSNQNISCSILADNKIYTEHKTDWTKRWFIDPLEFLLKESLTKNSGSISVDAIAYFGDEYSGNLMEKFDDGVISIKAIGRLRQKYATSDTLIILNLAEHIFVVTIGEFLPKKFIQGYKF